MTDGSEPLGQAPEAPAWRRWSALAIDLAAASTVLALFIIPAVLVRDYGGPAPGTLKTLGWVYLGALLGLGAVWAAKKRRQRRYVTIGMSIMDIRPVRVHRKVQMIRTADAPGTGRTMSSGLVAVLGGLLVVLAAGLLACEVILFA